MVSLPLPAPLSPLPTPFSLPLPLPFSSVFSRFSATTTISSLSPALLPFSAAIALVASSGEPIVTKPKPRHLPSSRALESALATTPYDANNAFNESDVVSSGKFFTQSFVPTGAWGCLGSLEPSPLSFLLFPRPFFSSPSGGASPLTSPGGRGFLSGEAALASAFGDAASFFGAALGDDGASAFAAGVAAFSGSFGAGGVGTAAAGAAAAGAGSAGAAGAGAAAEGAAADGAAAARAAAGVGAGASGSGACLEESPPMADDDTRRARARRASEGASQAA
mmetsp:Transcript_144391/g.462625  ORF Transcript_144391/g.462625 Transcript_144391/m.462625 type:complete len:279 (-) Transcript_144391:23-859(-)